jgi:hypothetical protein
MTIISAKLCLAMVRAMRVLPVPGGPCNNTPCIYVHVLKHIHMHVCIDKLVCVYVYMYRHDK